MGFSLLLSLTSESITSVALDFHSLTIYIRLHLQNGITAMLQFSCIIALSYSVSCSRAYSYRCFSKDYKFWMDLIHPTSGQYNSPHPYSQVSSSLSFSPAEVFGNSVAFFFFFFFCASSSFDSLKKNVGNCIIFILD